MLSLASAALLWRTVLCRHPVQLSGDCRCRPPSSPACLALQERDISAVCRTIEYMSPELLHNGHEGKDGKTSPYDPRSTGKVAIHTAGQIVSHARVLCC